ncbi:MAG TPA: multicopper oxidase domain-containing protein [Vicinamibacterales bacterium]
MAHRALPLVLLAALTAGARHPAAPATSLRPAVSETAIRPADGDTASALPSILPNDNRQPAGEPADGAVNLDLTASFGVWHPEGPSGPGLRVAAFGTVTKPATVPGPLIRVVTGTNVHARVTNQLDAPLRVHGLCARDGSPCEPLDVAPGGAREVSFRAGAPGTYTYWASFPGTPLTFRVADDTQLSGAFVIDPPDAEPDRIIVITEWTSLSRDDLKQLLALDDPGAGFLSRKPRVRFLLNGLSWPHTERLTYTVGEPVRWRVVNLSTQQHPMHLHGFHFEVHSIGDGTHDTRFDPDARRLVVTHLMPPGSTMTMSWTPARAGNWLFHCHVMTHVSPTLEVDRTPRADAGAHAGHAHPGAGMTGMVLGITVRERDTVAERDVNTEQPEHEDSQPERALTLYMDSVAGTFGDARAYAFRAEPDVPGSNGNRTRPVSQPASNLSIAARVPGPALVLRRGEPVAITLVNNLPEPTAIHWHGMELESYYDGVHGWSGDDRRTTPLINPGERFVVRFTPPRAGTFIYHTHLHDRRQLTSGLYGALLVIGPDEPYDDTVDHVIVLGRHGPQPDSPVVANGSREPQMVWKAGMRHRVRVVNITPDDTLSVSLQSGGAPITWQPMAKDGATVPAQLAVSTPASQVLSVGETYDFVVDAPPGRRTLWLDVRSPGGRWHVQGRIIVR